MYLEQHENCWNTCAGAIPEDINTCKGACDGINACSYQCVPKCANEVAAAINCHVERQYPGVSCTCAASQGHVEVSSLESFALNLGNALKAKKNLREI